MAKFGEWTLVEDEMPNVDKCSYWSREAVILIVCTERETFSAIFERVYVKGQTVRRWWNMWENRIYDGPDIVAWMPLPEPYRGEKS